MNYFYLILLSIPVAFLSKVGIAQTEVFVSFETTNQTNVVCQDKILGVIATLTPEYEYFVDYNWVSDAENIKTIKEEIAIVNSSLPGEKKLKFTLTIDEKHKLDTVFIVKVLPKPKVSLAYRDGKLSFSEDNGFETVSYKWVHNKTILSEDTSEAIENPNPGKYRVVVTDSNGCVATSQEFVIE